MGLKLYKQKRKFDKTPEPSGEEVNHEGPASRRRASASRGGPLKFVIQKHHASRLHYDFRLEADGVLKSWAVPKGPSLDPSVKRLAMMVEDHPLDYRNFEGVIPKGNYGAGNVIIWDEGTYEALENPKDSDEQIQNEIASGSVKIKLFGEKLNGAWALVKIKNSDEKNAWLLIKESDEYATSEDITEAEESVKSGLTVDEIGDGKVSEKKILENIENLEQRLRKEKVPDLIRPMLATLIDKPFDSSDFIFEIKWDGYRAIANIKNKKASIYSRNKIYFNKDYPSIVVSLEKFKFDAVLDGEIVILDKNGKPDFSALQSYKKSKEGNLVYFVFDILYLNGYNTQSLPIIKRKELLEEILPEMDNVKFSSHVENDGIKFFNASKKQGLEGVIAKRKDSTYQPGERNSNWVKIKTHLRQEAIICGYTTPRGTRNYFGALILGIYDENRKLTYVGHTGGGFDEESLKLVNGKLEKIKIDKCPFETVPVTNEPATWVKPELICEVSFAQWTSEHHMRHPIFEGLREDKNAHDVTYEEKKSGRLILQTTEEKISGVNVSNPDKIFWPNEGYTKSDLVKYYELIAPLILPYLYDRPESLRRYPNGIIEEGFFQKDFTYKLPEFVKSYGYDSESAGKKVNYIVCNNKQTLVYMVNLGCIDINPWNSRIGKIENPDYIIFDLDPEEIGFEKVVDAANEIHRVLETLEIESFPKTSGATGIHIYVPTGAKYTYDQVKSFSEIVVNVVNKKNPEFTSCLRSPTKRSGKVYLDFLQNRIGQTLAAPYSVRAKPGATVSTPLLWREINHKLSPSNFTIQNILPRIEKVGDLWKGVLGPGVDIKKILPKLEKLI